MPLAAFASLHPRFDAASGLLELELDHGKANEIGTEALTAFEALCAWVEAEDAVACVSTTSRKRTAKGNPIFVSGADVRERIGWPPERIRAHVERQRALMARIRTLPVFTVVLSTGATLGWGLEYCLACDYVLAAPEAFFALPETGLGIIPGAGGTALLAERIGLAQALRLGCTGERLDAAEAKRIGLVDEIATDIDAGLERIRALAALLRRRSPTAVATFKQVVLAGLGRPLAERLDLEARGYHHTVETGDAEQGRATFGSDVAPTWSKRRTSDL